MAKILVVDDDVPIAEMLQEMLETEDHAVTTAHTGQEGVQLFTREPFDLVIQDINLPGGVSGYGACQTYKSLGDTVAVLIMTGEFTSDQDEILARRLGADGFLRKPFAPRLLTQEVTRLLEERATVLGEFPVWTCRACEALFPVQESLPRDGSLRLACPNCGRFAQVNRKEVVWEKPEERKGPQGPEARRILVADDNGGFRQFMAFLLKRAGHVVLEAKTGREGLEFSKQWEPHLVISDVILPELDGLTMAKKIKEDPKTAKIPLLFLTTVQTQVYEQQAKQVGATFLSRPIRPEALLESVNRLLAGYISVTGALIHRGGDCACLGGC